MQTLRDFFTKLKLAFIVLFFKNKILAFFTWLSLLLNLVSWAGVIWLINLNQPELIFRFNAYLGISQIIDISQEVVFWEVFQIPLQALGVLVLNLGACVLLYISSLQSNQDLVLLRKKQQATNQSQEELRRQILNDPKNFSSSPESPEESNQIPDSQKTISRKDPITTPAQTEEQTVKEVSPLSSDDPNHLPNSDSPATPSALPPPPDLSFWGTYFITAGGMTMQLVVAIYTLAIVLVNS